MRKMSFAFFFSIIIILFGVINYYIFNRGFQTIPTDSIFRTIYIVVFTLLSWSYVAGRFLERVSVSWISDASICVGSYWLGAILYLFLFVVGIDILRLFNSFFPFFPSFVTENIQKTKIYVGLGVLSLTIGIVLFGYINARSYVVKTMELVVPKKAGTRSSLNIVLASDLHLGTIIGTKRLKSIVETVNALNPDIILFAGDVVDEDVGPLIKQNGGEILEQFKSAYGTYAITGNHEFIGGVEKACAYLQKHGIRELRDSSLLIDNSFYLIGREDRSIRQFNGQRRKPLEQLVAGLDTTKPMIMMDHQPFGLDEAGANGIDLQLSGHTHHGQLFPFNLITKKVYELSWGYLKKNNTHFYVSSGLGTWGPPMRIGNTPEIVQIKLSFLQ
jgi:hypothetical protein